MARRASLHDHGDMFADDTDWRATFRREGSFFRRDDRPESVAAVTALELTPTRQPRVRERRSLSGLVGHGEGDLEAIAKPEHADLLRP
jgi:hypothetical protein